MNGIMIFALIGLVATFAIVRRRSAAARQHATPQPPVSRRRKAVVVSYEAELAALTAQIQRDAARSRWSSGTAERRDAA